MTKREILKKVAVPEQVQYPAQVQDIRNSTGRMFHMVSDAEIEILWREFSNTYAASYLLARGEDIDHFVEWCLDEIEEAKNSED